MIFTHLCLKFTWILATDNFTVIERRLFNSAMPHRVSAYSLSGMGYIAGTAWEIWYLVGLLGYHVSELFARM